jgi:hypothetical protein
MKKRIIVKESWKEGKYFFTTHFYFAFRGKAKAFIAKW